jgi:hypothetical protein
VQDFVVEAIQEKLGRKVGSKKKRGPYADCGRGWVNDPSAS